MDKGAHFYRCDFQVHTPRDLGWTGPSATTDDERLAYGKRLIAACRERGINAVAITDHHCMTFVPHIRQAAAEETAADGTECRSGNDTAKSRRVGTNRSGSNKSSATVSRSASR